MRSLRMSAKFRAYLAKLPVKQPLAVWLNLETGEREAEGFGTRIASDRGSSKAGEGRSVWFDEKGEALKALAPFWLISNGRRSCTDPKVFSCLPGGPRTFRMRRTLFVLAAATTANHNFADAVMRQFSR